MLNNILIFRTDRIGDLLLSCPAIISIKNHFSNSKITLVTSEKNYNYAKNLNIFDQVYKYPKFNIINKILLIKKLNSYNFKYIFIFDGKDRSLISSIFIKAPYKVAVISEKKASNFWKIFKIKIINNTKLGIIELINDSLVESKININISNFNFLKYKKDNNFSSNIKIKKYLHIHLDEKWLKNLYIKKYTEINPTYLDFTEFLRLTSKKFNILITTGLVDFELINNLKNKYFEKINEKIYFKKNNKNFLYFIYKPSFEDIESLLRNTDILISCHGAVTHAANSFNVKIIDIIEKNKSKWYSRYTSYLHNYKSIFREDFSNMNHKLLKIVNYE